MSLQYNIGQFFTDMFNGISTNLVFALLILVVGTLIAVILSNLTRNILQKISLDNVLAKWINKDDEDTEEKSMSIEKLVSSLVFYLVMLFVLIQALGTFDPNMAAGPLQEMLINANSFIPKLIKAVVLSLVAILAANLTKIALAKLFSVINLESRLSAISTDESKVTRSLVDSVFWLIILFFLPVILAPLGLESLLTPLYKIGDLVVDYIDNIIGAAVLFGVGYLIAKIIKQVILGLLNSSGVNNLAEKVSLSKVFGQYTVADIISTVVYFLILFTVTVQALDVLAIEAVSEPAKEILFAIFAALKGVIGAGLGLGAAYVFGKLISDLVVNLLTNIGFNNLFAFLGLPQKESDSKRTPAQIIGYITLIIILLFTGNIIAQKLGFNVLSDKLDLFILFTGQVILGLIIFGVGLFLSNFASQAISSSSIQQSRILALVAQVAILFVASAMALTQIGVGKEIVDLAFGILLGAIGIAFAIAFGLGCKDIAKTELETLIGSLRDESPKKTTKRKAPAKKASVKDKAEE